MAAKVTYHVEARLLDNHKPCRGCGEPVVWIATPSGKRMPLDLGSKEPAQAGGFELEPHWGFCKNADSFRRSKR